MPIWFELMVLMLVTYVIGLAIGWIIWGRAPDSDRVDNASPADGTNSEGDTET